MQRQTVRSVNDEVRVAGLALDETARIEAQDLGLVAVATDGDVQPAAVGFADGA
jgi:hypothetical protein